MGSASKIASLIQQFEAKNEKSLMRSPTSIPNKIENTKVTNSSPDEKSPMGSPTSIPNKIDNTKVTNSSPDKKSLKGSPTSSSNKIDNAKVTNSSPDEKSLMGSPTSILEKSNTKVTNSSPNEKSLMGSPTSSPNKTNSTKVTISSPNKSRVGSPTSIPNKTDNIKVTNSSPKKSLMGSRTSSPKNIDNTKVTNSSPKKSLMGSRSSSPNKIYNTKVTNPSPKKSLMGSRTSSPNKIHSTKVTNSSPRSVISKFSSSLSSDGSDVDCSSLSDRFSSDLSLSREDSSFLKSDESSSKNLALASSSSCSSFSLLHNKNVDIWVSPLDLDEENSQLLEEEEEQQDLDSFPADLPSPSVHTRSKCKSLCKKDLNKNSTLNFDMEEPIFWPFDDDSYKISDLDKFLCVSPRRSTLHMDIPVKSGLDPIGERLLHKSNALHGVPGVQRKVAPNPEPNITRTASGALHIPIMPSRLGRSSNVLNDSKEQKLVHPRYTVERNLTKPLRNLIHGGLRNFKESSIEKSIGLHEFDGHEGIEEFGGDNEIFLCGSPWQAARMMKIGAQKIKRGPFELL